MGSGIRSFVALELAREQQRSIAGLIRQLAARWPEYRWVTPRHLHLTLNFLGEVPDLKIPRVCEIVREVASRHEEFTFEFGRLGAFPKTRRPRVLWLGIEEGKSRISRIHYDLAEALEELRLERDHKGYRPHVTLGRIRNDSRWPDSVARELEAENPPHPGSSEASELVLFASHEERTGIVYTPMDRAPLG